MENPTHDVFISYASEDREAVARPLAEELTRRGHEVWYDRMVLTLGDNLRRVIERGLADSRFGVVVLSRSFFAKEWPQRELDVLFAREKDGTKVILPIRHDVTEQEVLCNVPMLAERVWVDTSQGMSRVVDAVEVVIRRDRMDEQAAGRRSTEAMAESNVCIVTNVWYTPRRYKLYSYIASDIGTLYVYEDHIEYRGQKDEDGVRIAGITGIKHTKMPGDINNSWVEVRYSGADGEAAAYFSDAKKLGIGSLLGGSEELFRALLQFHPGDRSAV